MGKYDPLNAFLATSRQNEFELSFDEIEDILARPLPPSAHRHQAWWANETHGSHSHARSWQEAGWKTSRINLPAKRVRFVRKRILGGESPAVPPGRNSGPDGSRSLEALISTAMEISGLDSREAVIEMALRAYIEHEAGKRLIAMGGTMPDAWVPDRRRFI